MGKKKNCDIYCESHDSGNIYIEISDLSECCFEIWDIEGNTKSRAKIKISLKDWEQLIKKWSQRNTMKGNKNEYL